MAKIIVLSGVIGWDITGDSVREALSDANGSDVEFHASGPGGLVFEGIEIFNIIRAYSGNTDFIITGIAASMMSYIALAADKVKAYDNATFMIHNPWNFAIGDYNDMQEVADMLKGLTGILAKEYIKQTSKSQSDMKTLMDKDSYFFGDEMLSEGFVDEIIEAPEKSDDNDRSSAIATAQASVQACYSRIRESKAANDDLQKAVAYFEGMSALTEPIEKSKPVAVAINKAVIKKTAVAEKKKQEVKHMATLLELLAADPAARVEYDAAIVTAKAEGIKVAKSEISALVTKLKPVLESAAYDEGIKAFGTEVLMGTKTLEGFEAIVFMADKAIEAQKAKDAEAETAETKETPGAGGAVGDVEAKAAYDAKKGRIKGEV